MNKLPFLNNQKVPKLRKLSGISKYGFSEDDDLIEGALNEFAQAVEAKDHPKMMKALMAIVDCIMNKESEGPHENDEETAS